MTDPENPRFQPHVLVITGDTADEREFEIEHPDACPLVCFWAPGIDMREWVHILGAHVPSNDKGHRDCYVEFEVSEIGLDSLDLGDDPPCDPAYAGEHGINRWRQLPPGRYIIEGWFRKGLGLMPWGEDESEGGLILIGPA